MENPLPGSGPYAWEIPSKTGGLLAIGRTYDRIRRRVEADPAGADYRDLALTPVTEAEIDLEIFRATDWPGRRSPKPSGKALRPVQAA